MVRRRTLNALRTISSSARRTQSYVPRFVREVFDVMDHPSSRRDGLPFAEIDFAKRTFGVVREVTLYTASVSG